MLQSFAASPGREPSKRLQPPLELTREACMMDGGFVPSGVRQISHRANPLCTNDLPIQVGLRARFSCAF